jgi:hypothetical protein
MPRRSSAIVGSTASEAGELWGPEGGREQEVSNFGVIHRRNLANVAAVPIAVQDGFDVGFERCRIVAPAIRKQQQPTNRRQRCAIAERYRVLPRVHPYSSSGPFAAVNVFTVWF